MIELTFHADLYQPAAVDAAVAAFGAVARCQVDRQAEYHRVRLESSGDFPEARIADEFRNFVLGATIEAASAPDPATAASGASPTSQGNTAT